MHRYTENRVLPYTPEQVFDLVADVERYQDFVPGWLATRILKRTADGVEVDQVMGLGAFRLEFTSHATFKRPEELHITSHGAPFRSLDIHWSFTAAGPGGCLARFSVDYALSSLWLEKFLNLLFSLTMRRILTAFEKRARELYGELPPPTETSDQH